MNQKLYSMAVPHERVRTPVGKVSMTRQEFAADSDINVLMARYEKTGVWPLSHPGREPKYLDLSDVPDFHSAMQLVIEAQEAFMLLPAAARREFDNDAGKFVAFAEDPANLERMREWGLAPPAPEVPHSGPLDVTVRSDTKEGVQDDAKKA